MRPLRYSINVTLDGCCDHRVMVADEELHRHGVENLERADALLFGRVTYEMIGSVPAGGGQGSEAGVDGTFCTDDPRGEEVRGVEQAEAGGLERELVRGDVGKAVEKLKREPGKGLLVGGVKLPMVLAELGLIDKYELVVQPRLVGHGPTLFAGLAKVVDLRLVSRVEMGSGAVAMRYEPRR